MGNTESDFSKNDKLSARDKVKSTLLQQERITNPEVQRQMEN